MSQRYWSQFQLSNTKGLINVVGYVQFAGASAPTLMMPSIATNGTITYKAAPTGGYLGVKSIVRNNVGDYTVTLQDNYLEVLSFQVTYIGSSTAAAPLTQVVAGSNPNAAGATTGEGFTSTTNNAIEFFCFSAQNTKADPAATEMGKLMIQLRNSSAI